MDPDEKDGLISGFWGGLAAGVAGGLMSTGRGSFPGFIIGGTDTGDAAAGDAFHEALWGTGADPGTAASALGAPDAGATAAIPTGGGIADPTISAVAADPGVAAGAAGAPLHSTP